MTLTTESKLDILAEAQALILHQKNWSKDYAASKLGKECPAWDLDADAWSAFGAVEKVLSERNQFRYLVGVAGELESNAGGSLLAFDSKHSHSEVVELFHLTMMRLCEENDYSMFAPCEPFTPELGFNIIFISNKDLKAMDEADAAVERKYQEALDREKEEDYYS